MDSEAITVWWLPVRCSFSPKLAPNRGQPGQLEDHVQLRPQRNDLVDAADPYTFLLSQFAPQVLDGSATQTSSTPTSARSSNWHRKAEPIRPRPTMATRWFPC
ncbi:MAG: hypothetical protein R3E83_24180 [Burkholderiaceae bacterium]